MKQTTHSDITHLSFNADSSIIQSVAYLGGGGLRLPPLGVRIFLGVL